MALPEDNITVANPDPSRFRGFSAESLPEDYVTAANPDPEQLRKFLSGELTWADVAKIHKGGSGYSYTPSPGSKYHDVFGNSGVPPKWEQAGFHGASAVPVTNEALAFLFGYSDPDLVAESGFSGVNLEAAREQLEEGRVGHWGPEYKQGLFGAMTGGIGATQSAVGSASGGGFAGGGLMGRLYGQGAQATGAAGATAYGEVEADRMTAVSGLEDTFGKWAGFSSDIQRSG